MLDRSRGSDGGAWTVVASEPTRGAAAAVAAALQGSGFTVRLRGDDAGGVLAGVDALTGGVHVEVPAPDAAAARAFLAEPEPDEPVPDARGRDGDDPVVDEHPATAEDRRTERSSPMRTALVAALVVGLALAAVAIVLSGG